jgi:hypothetical protein
MNVALDSPKPTTAEPRLSDTPSSSRTSPRCRSANPCQATRYPYAFTRLRTFQRHQRHQLLRSQANTNSFAKTPGGCGALFFLTIATQHPPLPHNSFIYRIYADSRAKSFIYRFYASQPGVGGPKLTLLPSLGGTKIPAVTVAAPDFPLSTANLRCGKSLAPRIQLNSQQLLQGGTT